MRNTLKTLLAVFGGILAAELIFLGFLFATGEDVLPSFGMHPTETVTEAPVATTTEAPETTAAPTTQAPTTQEPTIPTMEATTAPTTEPAPTEEIFTLTFAGDCTLGSEPDRHHSPHSFVGMVGENYEYPFANVAEYFGNDDFTLINLEGVFADSGYGMNKQFTFRRPTAYTEILTTPSVEAVSLANNHSFDFGADGYKTTKEVLEKAGVSYVEENKTALFTTESGLTIGLYADAFQFHEGEIAAHVKNLRDAGAEVIVCAFHWGTEGSYRCNATQERYAHAAIDAGADIVYGHHPHVLQKIEHYGNGVIFYSLGNFSFGGNHFPRDYDSALVQQQVIRSPEGDISLGELVIIPVSISSMQGQNNFQPTPYEVGSAEYDRTLSKLDGTFKGPDLVVNYTPATTAPAETEAPSDPQAPAQTDAPETQETQAPADTEVPEETGTPGQTEEPETQVPDVTQMPETQAPIQTEAPETQPAATQPPAQTEAPPVTQNPAQTQPPAATEPPAQQEDPGPRDETAG